MADEKDKEPKKPPLPPIGGKPPLPPSASGGRPTPPPLPPMGGGKPQLPPGFPPALGAGKPSLPPVPPSAGRPAAPALPSLPGFGAPRPPAPPAQESAAEREKRELEKKLADMEKRLQEEREKLLVANLKSQEEAAASARVEVSIKELQDKLRRERRDQEQEESRLKLEARLQEMEQRLAQERETWVTTLRNQMQSRETQDKELEAHFAMRVQEMERRFLEEKANWQKLMLAKDEEARNLRALAEKLKGADVELSKTVAEKKWHEGRVAELMAERAEILAKAQTANERDKENIQLRADLSVARQQVAAMQERVDRELQALRISSKDREERLMADCERLQRELETAGARFRADSEPELRRYKDAADHAGSQLMKLRGIAGALEKQLAASRGQVNELTRAQERYKAEFVVLQRKWIEREKELRAEAERQMTQMLEAEKAKIKVLSQEEINQRVAKLGDSLRGEIESQVRAKYLAEADAARKELEGELDRLHKEMFRKDAEWSQRVLAKESELHATHLKLEDVSQRLAREEDTRQSLDRAKLELEKSLLAAREELGGLQTILADLKTKTAEDGEELSELRSRKEELERLATAQAAQVKNVEEALDQMRGQLAREAHLTKMYLQEKQELEQKAKGA